jgi:hypothetical protein
MNAAEVRGRADSFDPMKAARWTPWQALAWIVHLNVDRVRECSEIWKQKGPSSPVEGAELGPFRRIWEEMHNNPGPKESWAEAEMRPNPVRDGWHKLQLALESGRVTSSGIDVATGKKREISELEWDDLRFADPVIIKPCDPIILESSGYEYLCADGPQCYWEDAEFWRRPEPAFREVRVRRADVLKEFPAKQQALQQSDAPEIEVNTGKSTRARRKRSATKVLAVQRALLEIYPSGRPPAYRDEMQVAVEGHIGRKISLATLDRALERAWPASSNVIS